MIYLNLFIIFLLLIFIHELGHYISARFFGVKVTDFSIGFGKTLFSYTDNQNTNWKISLIPITDYGFNYREEEKRIKIKIPKLIFYIKKIIYFFNFHIKTPQKIHEEVLLRSKIAVEATAFFQLDKKEHYSCLSFWQQSEFLARQHV